MDERKRTYEPSDSGPGHTKRLKPEDILGTIKDDPNRVVTRLFLTTKQYSKVIGKGGQMIMQIRQLTGASLRCTELDEENRLVIIMGALVQVLNAFDVILQVITPAPASSSNAGQRSLSLSLSTATSNSNSDPLTVCLMMEHAKAGRVVGSRGSTLLALKNRSNATVRVEKDPTEYCGVVLRKVYIDGGNQSVRMVHYLLHELFVDPNTAALAVSCTPHLQALVGAGPLISGAGAGALGDDSMGMASFGRSLPASSSAQGGNSLSRYGPGDAVKSMPMYASNGSHHQHHQQQPQHSIYGPPPAAAIDSHHQHHQQQHAPYQHARGTSALEREPYYEAAVPAGEVVVPLPALVGYGVPPETVKQLVDMQTYLFQQFGLKLGTTKRGAVPQMQVLEALPVANTRPRRDSAADEMMGPVSGAMDAYPGRRSINSIEAVMAMKREDRPRDLFFAIPRSCVGGIIGRGGQFIRDLQSEFGVKVYVEKDEYAGQRICNLAFVGFGRERRDSRDGGPGRASAGGDAGERDRNRDRDEREDRQDEEGNDRGPEAPSSAPKKTVKRAAAGSEDEDGEGGRGAEAADVAAHKRNRRDETAKEVPVDAQERAAPLDDAEREGEEATAHHATTSPAPKRKGYSAAEPTDGDERERHASHKHALGEAAEGSDLSGGEEDDGEGRHKRQRGSLDGFRDEERRDRDREGDRGSSLVVASASKAPSPVNPMRSLLLCKERIEAMIEDLLQRQVNDPSTA